MTSIVDLACFSYLAAARLLTVDRYPAADTGAEVHDAHQSLAGDGPITAITAASQGLRVTLSGNDVGEDTVGLDLLAQLERYEVRHRISTRPETVTPNLTVITDRIGTRTWFAHLSSATADLLGADLSLLTPARLAYIDCYEIITDAAVRAIRHVTRSGGPLMLNLGGDPIHPAIQKAAVGTDLVAVQTSLPDDEANTAETVADRFYEQLRPQVALVTLGRYGVIARTETGFHHEPAGTGPIAHTHGAGAAFSAGFAVAHLAGSDIKDCLTHACRTGTEHCSPSPSPLSLPH
ncbi:carbohydrate kinase family protein [Herbidospora cretacea]|uniref:carbohydrate kinase family protein n=1 Tax=Herbidospora cretacea TaxID=28444 RepID=UPI00077488D8|nr:PfkB family carbohydrate kinase [Herbidospora cretacea]